MSMSVDSAQLETVIRYASFIELLTQPEKLKAILNDVKKTTKEYQDVLGPYTTKKEVDSFLSSENKKLLDASKDLAAREELVEKNRISNEAKYKTLIEETERILSGLNKKMVEAETTLSQAKEKETKAEQVLFQAERQFTLSEKQKADLGELEKKLLDKQDKLIKLLG